MKLFVVQRSIHGRIGISRNRKLPETYAKNVKHIDGGSFAINA